MLLFGKPVAEKILLETKAAVTSSGVTPGLAVVIVGHDPASQVYVGIKETRAKEIGMSFESHRFEESVSESQLVETISSLNVRNDIHGIIVQLPLPKHLDANRIIAAIDAKKDADGFLAGIPVFPEAMMELAKSSGVSFSGRRGVAIVNSERLGKSVADLFRKEGSSAEYIFSEDIGANRSTIGQADIVFSAIGNPGILFVNMFKDGAVVIDGGISKCGDRVCGDVSHEGSDERILLSPVPGGIGPVTVACLLRRVMKLAIENEKAAS